MTQVAEVAVNRACRKVHRFPSREAAGSIKRQVPTQMMAKKVTAISLVALISTRE